MRLILLNPHANLLGKLVFQWLFDYPQLQTYSYLLKCYAEEATKTIAFLIDGEQSSFYPTSYGKKLKERSPRLFKIFSYVEFFVWLALNKINPFRHKIYFRLKKLNPETDVIFTFALTNRNKQFYNYSGTVVAHLTHYHHDTEAVAEYTKNLQHSFLAAENDLTKNNYFKHYFPWMERVYVLPFVFSGRFKRTKDFQQRSNKCFASGSMSVPSAPSYVKYFGSCSALQPMRQIIYDRQKNLQDVMDIFIYPHHDALKDLKEIKDGDGLFVRWMKKELPGSVLKKLFSYQLPYFRFDIVEKYNQYQMFISPEERTGLPSLKMLEGVRCGSVLVGINDPMYAAIGFKDGINYISYAENNLEDLKQKIKHYQRHPDHLEKIAQAGYEFVSDSFAPKKVADQFWHDLEKLL